MHRHPFRFWVIASLLVANLAVGVVSLYFLRGVNAHYAGLFEHGIPVVNSLRTLTREQTALQRAARVASESQDESDFNELLAQIESSIGRVRDHATGISTAALLRGTKHADALLVASRDYETRVNQFLLIARTEKQAAAGRFNNEVLRPAYDRMQLVLDDAATYLEEQGSNLRDRYTQESRFFGGLSLASTGWPIAAGLVVMVVLGVLVFMLFLTIFTPERGWSHKHVGPPPGSAA
ncbi:MAG TPA: MCP four helix bundle domain-containing protein [Candidatus Didemnitutus sp.]|nr:MCP four helix bundle domain-containing protein [Candidatus Didemnitutus sp.]